MRDVIEVDKILLPYAFDIELAGENFTLEINYNAIADLFTVTLSNEDEILCYNEPIIYGVELFTDIYKSGKYPKLAIVPLCEAGEETAVTYENFGVTVFLTIDDEPEEESEA